MPAGGISIYNAIFKNASIDILPMSSNNLYTRSNQRRRRGTGAGLAVTASVGDGVGDTVGDTVLQRHSSSTQLAGTESSRTHCAHLVKLSYCIAISCFYCVNI